VYSSAISIKNVVPGLSTRALVAAVGGTCLALALTVDLASFQGFLYLVGSLITPLFGVLFADYFLLRRRRYTSEELYPLELGGQLPWGANPIALLAWAAGVGAYLVETTYVHWLGGTLPSLGASMAAYLLMSLAIKGARPPHETTT
jgi:purine-cytosine permease-like protein